MGPDEHMQADQELPDRVAPIGLRERFAEAAGGECLADGVEDGLLVRVVVVEAHGPHPGRGGKASHVERLQTISVDDVERQLDDPLSRQGPSGLAGHRLAPSSRTK
jgi:hypothetical protein